MILLWTERLGSLEVRMYAPTGTHPLDLMRGWFRPAIAPATRSASA